MSLTTLLDRGAAYDAEYAAGLSNHLPMALTALQGLGAPEARLDAFAARYGERLVAAPAAERWPAGDPWPSRLGERAAWPAYRALFAEWITWEGADRVLFQVLPVLMPGCGAVAFHGLIRTAYAAAGRHEGEVVDGLAYWACRYLDLGPTLPPDNEADPEAVLDGLLHFATQRRFEQGLIVERMAAALAVPGVRAQAARLRIDAAATLPLLAQRATALYAQSGNFTVLHLVTSCHALRLLMPWIEAPQDALRSYWLAYAAGVAASGLDAALAGPASAVLSTWDDLRAAAIASDDEHVIKLVYTCQEEAALTGDAACRRAAGRAAFG